MTNQLERSETYVAVLKSRIDDMQRINTDAVEKNKSLFQNENASLKLAYEQATFKIKDLSKQLSSWKSTISSLNFVKHFKGSIIISNR